MTHQLGCKRYEEKVLQKVPVHSVLLILIISPSDHKEYPNENAYNRR